IRKGGTSIEIDLIPNELSNDVIILSYSVNTAGLISGKVRRQMTDYNALKYRKNVVDEKEETYLEKLEQEYGNIEIADYQRNNAKDINLPVSETFSFTSSNSTELMGGKIYINPMLFYASHENPFKQEVREYPVDFGFPFMDKYAINIQIPEGYKIESMPTSSNFSTLDNIGSFKFMTSTSGNTIQVSIVSQMNTPIIASEYYAMLKEFYKTMIDKQNEKIVLVKI
ncbi:MAG: transglutaminase, partial [Crocinitomicaceae bacterium]|nr:transglutaminase [Crocinitomicaceae bacterium]